MRASRARKQRQAKADPAVQTAGPNAFSAKAATHLTGQVTTSRSLLPRELERTVWACRNALLRFGLPLPEVETTLREGVTRALLPLALGECGGELDP